MQRSYAGVLALIAFITVILRGTVRGASTESIVFYAWLSLLVFAVCGYLIGAIAASVVDHAAELRVVQQLARTSPENSTSNMAQPAPAETPQPLT